MNTTQAAVVRDVPRPHAAGSTPAPLPADPDLSPRAVEVDASRVPLATTLTPAATHAPRVGRQLAGAAAEAAPARTSGPTLPRLNHPESDAQIGPTAQVVDVAPIPEPSTSVLLCAAGIAALARRGKRRALPKPTSGTSDLPR